MTIQGTKPALPSQFPRTIAPWDAACALTDLTGNTLTATAYSQFSAADAVVDLGAGRGEFAWALDIQAIKVSAGDELYKFALLGSNDAAFGNGNCELLGFHDYAAVASARVVPTLLAEVSATGVVVPDPKSAGSFDVFPFMNYVNGVTFRYARLRLIVSGTLPSITFLSWITGDLN